MNKKTGILLINLGTPCAPHPAAIKKYLAEFLSDPHIVPLPKLIWLPFLHTVILNIRPHKKAKAYQKIWTSEGSPLLVNSQKQQQKLQQYLDPEKKYRIVKLAMRYGEPAIPKILNEFKEENIERIIILPLFPQYSSVMFDSINAVIQRIIRQTHVHASISIIKHYYDHPDYIRALSRSVQKHWLERGKSDYLLFSFHGLPQKLIDKGDPYQKQCETTANLVAKALNLQSHEWSSAFQSRFGKAAWIKPYTTTVLKKLALSKITKKIIIICPGFTTDCLETLEEINIQNRNHFLKAGGKRFDYISALNDSPDHIQMMANLVLHSE